MLGRAGRNSSDCTTGAFTLNAAGNLSVVPYVLCCAGGPEVVRRDDLDGAGA